MLVTMQLNQLIFFSSSLICFAEPLTQNAPSCIPVWECACVKVCMCMCAFVCICIHMCVLKCGDHKPTSVVLFLRELIHLFWDRISYWNLMLTSSTSLAGQWTLGILVPASLDAISDCDMESGMEQILMLAKSALFWTLLSELCPPAPTLSCLFVWALNLQFHSVRSPRSLFGTTPQRQGLFLLFFLKYQPSLSYYHLVYAFSICRDTRTCCFICKHGREMGSNERDSNISMMNFLERTYNVCV